VEEQPVSRHAPWLLIAALACAAPAGAQDGKGNRYAFLVGCSKYLKTEFRTLPYTGNDVEGFRTALLATGFRPENIVLMHDGAKELRYIPERSKVFRELDLLIDGMRPEDTLVVALSGHGLQFKDDPVSYFVPLDGRVTDKGTLIPLNGKGGLYEKVKAARAKKKLLIVNACRNDPTVDLAFAANKGVTVDQDRDEVPEGIAAIYSCQMGQKSYYDPDRKRALFFDHVIRAWKGEYTSGGKVTLEEFFRLVTDKTSADARTSLGEPQKPHVTREFAGEWVITTAPAAVKVDLAGDWAGKTVILRGGKGAFITFADGPAAPALPYPLGSTSCRVLKDQAGRILVRGDGPEGWLDKAEAIPVDQAVAFFTARLNLDPQDVDALLRRSLAWWHLGDFAKAQADVDEALRLQPGNARVHNVLGVLAREKKDPEQALKAFGEAIRLDPNLAMAYQNRALVWMDKKEYDRAMLDLDDAIRLSPKFASAHYDRGRAWAAKKQLDRALGDFDQAVRFAPSFALAYLHRGNAWWDKKESAKAIQDYTDAIRADPKFALAYTNRGNAWRHLKEYAKALDDYDEAIRLDKKPHLAHYNRGLLWANKGEHGRAVKDFDEAIRLSPKVAAYHVDRGRSLAQQKLYDQAMQAYDEAIALAPKFAAAYLDRGNAWWDKKESAKAIQDYTEAIRADPQYAMAYNNRGNAWRVQKDFAKALPDLDEAIRLDPKLFLAYHNRGLVWAEKGDHAQAVRDLSEAIKLNPTAANYYLDRGRSLALQKEYDKAVQDYDEAIRLDAKNASAYNLRGNVWSAKKDYDRAIKDYDEAIRIDANYASPRFNRGIAWSNKKEYDKAIKDYDDAIRIDPKFTAAYHNLAWLRSTCPDAKYRNGSEAVKLAMKLCDQAGWKDGSSLNVLAAAYAESGQFDSAVRFQNQALQDATWAAANGDLGRKRLELYKQKKALH
jgi:tetratricopeptide (TPR) repeat protein